MRWIVVLSLCGLLGSDPAGAARRLNPGAVVRVTAPTLSYGAEAPLVARFAGISADSLFLRQRQSGLAVPLVAIDALEASHGRRVLRGLGIGFATGAGLGAVMGAGDPTWTSLAVAPLPRTAWIASGGP